MLGKKNALYVLFIRKIQPAFYPAHQVVCSDMADNPRDESLVKVCEHDFPLNTFLYLDFEEHLGF